MAINKLIKSAIQDKTPREKLLNDPIRTCKEYGITTDADCLGNLDSLLFTDSTVRQGGYRP